MQSDFHNKGGYFFIANLNKGYSRGVKRLFSDKCPNSNEEVVNYFGNNGYEIVNNTCKGSLSIVVAKRL